MIWRKSSWGVSTVVKCEVNAKFFDNTVEIIDGRSGENILSGTDGSDTLDVSGTKLSHIDDLKVTF